MRTATACATTTVAKYKKHNITRSPIHLHVPIWFVCAGSVGEVRVTMLLFRNASEADPRTKVWLDGATISMAGGEALLVSYVGVLECWSVEWR